MLKIKEDIYYLQLFGKMYSLYYWYCVSIIVVIFLVFSNYRVEDVYFWNYLYWIGFCCNLLYNW